MKTSGRAGRGRIAPYVDFASPILVMHWGRLGGGPRFAVSMYKALRESWAGGVLTSFNRTAEIMNQTGEDIANGLPVTTYDRPIGLVLGIPKLVVLGFSLRKFIRRNGVKTVYSAMTSVWQAVCTAVFLPADVVFVASIHDAVEHPGEQHWVLRLCRRLDVGRADVIATYSQSARLILESQIPPGGVPIIDVPFGADAPAVTPRSIEARGSRPITLGFVGRIVEYKGIDLFAQTVRLLADAGMHVRGIVAGRGEVSAELVESTHDIIDWQIGWIPESELAHVLNQIDVLVLPYREASQSGVYSLALSAGLPTVATPVGGLVEQVGASGGVLAATVSALALADAVRELTIPQRYAETSRKCLAAAAGSNSWGNAARQLGTELAQISADEAGLKAPDGWGLGRGR